MNIKVKLSPMAYLPERAHDTDAGADIHTPESFTVKAFWPNYCPNCGRRVVDE